MESKALRPCCPRAAGVPVLALLLLAASPRAPAQLSRVHLVGELELEEGVIEVSSPASGIGSGLARAGDIDGDGLDDLLLAASGKQAVLLIFGQASLPGKVDPFQGGVRMLSLAIGGLGTSSPDLAGGADVSGDGRDDFLVGGGSQTVVVFGSEALPPRFAVEDVGDLLPLTSTWVFNVPQRHWLHVLYGGPDLPTRTHPALFPRRTRIAPETDLDWTLRVVDDLDGGKVPDLVWRAYEPGSNAANGV